MNKTGSYTRFLSALAAAGLFSAMLRGGGAVEHASPSDKGPSQSAPAMKPAVSGVESGMADLEPVMELLGQSLGVAIEPDTTLRELRALHADLEGSPDDRSKRASTVLGEFVDALQSPDLTDEAKRTRAALLAAELDTFLRSDLNPGARFHGLRDKIANRFLDEANDQDVLVKLTTRVTTAQAPALDVQFIVATVPDYVDSNSGWVADETLGAIQSAMSHAGFVLDRFRLIDWTRADDTQTSRVTNDSRLHERQPGALIFRNVEGSRLTFQVVLLVLETPTTGVHRRSLKNAMHLVHAWAKRIDPNAHASLRLVAPIFSGSIPSLSLELKEWEGSPALVDVVTGSAMADDNPLVVARFAPGIRYRATMPPTSVVMKALSAALGRMNRPWSLGRDVGLLVEGNTSFGQSAAPSTLPRDAAPSAAAPGVPPCDAPRRIEQETFPCAVIYRFPLHVAQLRSDAATSPSTVSLLPTPIVPLRFRETTPASDQLPALRPQLASPVAEATIDNILDNIRHQNLSAVGIVATDSRDVLFLAREVKRAAPDVQLFFVGSYLLYLQPDYLPYTRGALVASPYPLALGAQRRSVPGRMWEREAFPSFIAAGVFNAMSIQLGSQGQLFDYCSPNLNFTGSGTRSPCVPPVWLTVIGNDGYWPIGATPLAGDRRDNPLMARVDGTPMEHHQPPLPTTAGLLALTLVTLVGAAVWARLSLSGRFALSDEALSRTPYLRVIAPPTSDDMSVVRLHSVAVVLGALVLACPSAWLTAVLILQVSTGAAWSSWAAGISAVAVFGLVLAPGVTVLRKARTGGPGAPHSRWHWLRMLMTLGPMACAIGGFLVFTWDTVAAGACDPAPACRAFTVSRVLGGGMVSPLPAAMFLFGGLLVGMTTSVRRISQVGIGYRKLADNSAAFRLFTVAPRNNPGDSLSTDRTSDDNRGRDLRYFTALLDLPVQNLPRPFFVGLVALVVAILWVMRGAPATIDGAAFSWFLLLASVSIFVAAFLLAGQAAATWQALHSKLIRLSSERIGDAFARVHGVVRWQLSLAPPRLSELMPVALRADALRDQMLSGGNMELSLGIQLNDRRSLNQPMPRTADVATLCATTLTVRSTDLHEVIEALDRTRGDDRPGAANKLRFADRLGDEIVNRKSAPLLLSATWRDLWTLSDRLVALLERSQWRRIRGAVAAVALPDDGPDAWTSDIGTLALRPGDPSLPTAVRRPGAAHPTSVEQWFDQCEQIVALQYAFVLRDILARTMSTLFAAMLCLLCVSAAHLFYVFPGRSSLLAIDLLAMLAMTVVATPIVMGMEKDTVISRLRGTVPGHIDFSMEFAKQVALYGVLPLLAVIGALFPEIGSSFFGWIEPLRKLAAF
jgi:hypothetical protein